MTSKVKTSRGVMGRPTKDSPKALKVTSVAFEEEDLEWLKKLPHGVSYNVREAIRLLKQQALEEKSA